MCKKRSTKKVFATAMLKLAASSMIIFLLLFTSSCGMNDAKVAGQTDSTVVQKSGSDSAGPGKATFTTSDELRTLYVENSTTNRQLLRLLQGNQKQKLVFQLYRDSIGFIRLLITPGQGLSAQYFFSDTIQPKISDIIQENLTRRYDVILGDLQLTNRTAGNPITTMRNNIGNPRNDNTWRYIWFVPKIGEETDEATPPTFRKNYLTYVIVHSNSLPYRITDFSKMNAGTALTINIADAKPSPPRNLE